MVNQETIWILGGGKFGSRAARVLRKQLPAARILVVDIHDPDNLPGDVDVVCDDCVSWLVDNLTQTGKVSKIVPAVPLHVAVEWLKRKLALAGFIVQPTEIPDSVLQRLPNPFNLAPNQIAVSHADFLCPPNCPEPDIFCTATGQPRPMPLYQMLASMVFEEFIPVILRSRQFSSGVGGFYPDDLWNLLRRCSSLPAKSLLIGTACKCHGIVDGLNLQAQS
jgi:hypothetical protein